MNHLRSIDPRFSFIFHSYTYMKKVFKPTKSRVHIYVTFMYQLEGPKLQIKTQHHHIMSSITLMYYVGKTKST